MARVDVAVIGGGQAGPATAHALRRPGLEPVVLEASERAAGSWPRHYDSLALFSPARYSSLPGLPFGGAPDRYPHREEVIAYLGALRRQPGRRHRESTSLTHTGLAHVGLEWQRSLSSNSLRGVGRDAVRVAHRLAAQLRGG